MTIIGHPAPPRLQRLVVHVCPDPDEFESGVAYIYDASDGEIWLNPDLDVAEQLRCVAAVLRRGALEAGAGFAAPRRPRLVPADAAEVGW